jgi:hypothetical protein
MDFDDVESLKSLFDKTNLDLFAIACEHDEKGLHGSQRSAHASGGSVAMDNDPSWTQGASGTPVNSKTGGRITYDWHGNNATVHK